jgi:hypothetical protein
MHNGASESNIPHEGCDLYYRMTVLKKLCGASEPAVFMRL